MKKCDGCPEKAIGCRPATCPICGEEFCDNLTACPACGWCGEEDFITYKDANGKKFMNGLGGYTTEELMKMPIDAAALTAEFCEKTGGTFTGGNTLEMKYKDAKVVWRGDIPDADEFAYINKRVLDKYPTAEFIRLQRLFIPEADATPSTKVRWEFIWIVWDFNNEVKDED